MDLATNPLPHFILLVACALLTSASCAAFTRIAAHYERVMRQCQDMIGAFDLAMDSDPAALQMRMRQVKAAGRRALLIMKSFDFFYAAIASFGLSSMLSLLSTVVCYARFGGAALALFAAAVCTNVFGTVAIIAGATMRIREARCTLRVFHEKSSYFTDKAGQIILRNAELSPDR